jgi:hypothetical protein
MTEIIVQSPQVNQIAITEEDTTVTVQTATIELVSIVSEGVQGAAGAGVAPNGDPGNILLKNSYNNYDTVWSSTLDGGTFN